MTARQVYHPALSPDQFGTLYHGTHREMAHGDLVQSSGVTGAIEAHPIQEMKALDRQHQHVYATNRFSDAAYYALSAGKGTGHVYKVEPTGAVKTDPNHPGAFMSRHPMRVVGEM